MQRAQKLFAKNGIAFPISSGLTPRNRVSMKNRRFETRDPRRNKGDKIFVRKSRSSTNSVIHKVLQ